MWNSFSTTTSSTLPTTLEIDFDPARYLQTPTHPGGTRRNQSHFCYLIRSDTASFETYLKVHLA